jgi:hypothetical protein
MLLMSILESNHGIVSGNNILLHYLPAYQTKLFLKKTLKFALINELLIHKLDLIAKIYFIDLISSALFKFTLTLNLHHLLSILFRVINLTDLQETVS